MVPKTTVEVDDEGAAKKILRLMDALEENDDVQDVYANFDIPERVLEAVAALVPATVPRRSGTVPTRCDSILEPSNGSVQQGLDLVSARTRSARFEGVRFRPTGSRLPRSSGSCR